MSCSRHLGTRIGQIEEQLLREPSSPNFEYLRRVEEVRGFQWNPCANGSSPMEDSKTGDGRKRKRRRSSIDSEVVPLQHRKRRRLQQTTPRGFKWHPHASEPPPIEDATSGDGSDSRRKRKRSIDSGVPWVPSVTANDIWVPLHIQKKRRLQKAQTTAKVVPMTTELPSRIGGFPGVVPPALDKHFQKIVDQLLPKQKAVVGAGKRQRLDCKADELKLQPIDQLISSIKAARRDRELEALDYSSDSSQSTLGWDFGDDTSLSSVDSSGSFESSICCYPDGDGDGDDESEGDDSGGTARSVDGVDDGTSAQQLGSVFINGRRRSARLRLFEADVVGSFTNAQGQRRSARLR